MYFITQSKILEKSNGQNKQSRNLALQLAITQYNLKFPHLHEESALLDIKENCAQEHDLNSSLLEIPGIAD